MHEKTVYFTASETFPTRMMDTKAMIPRVLNQFPLPQNYHRSVLVERGNTTPHARIKQTDCRTLQGGRMMPTAKYHVQGACNRDLVGTDLAGTRTQDLVCMRT